jgi:hypothetical protein
MVPPYLTAPPTNASLFLLRELTLSLRCESSLYPLNSSPVRVHRILTCCERSLYSIPSLSPLRELTLPLRYLPATAHSIPSLPFMRELTLSLHYSAARARSVPSLSLLRELAPSLQYLCCESSLRPFIISAARARSIPSVSLL